MSKKLMLLSFLLMVNLSQANEINWNIMFDHTYQLPLVKLNIQGKDLVFNLDTGSKQGLDLPIDIINKIPNKIENHQKIEVSDLAGNTKNVRSFVVSDLILNAFHFKKIIVAEYKKWGFVFSSDETDSSDHMDIPAIGLGLFDNYVLTLNFPEKKVTISDETNNPNIVDSTWISLPFQMNKEGIVINMTDGIKKYTMVLDSGASNSIIKDQSLSSTIVKDDDFDSDYSVVTLHLNKLKTESTKAIVLDSLPSEFKSDGLLGVDFLNQYLVKINFKTKQIWIKPANNDAVNLEVPHYFISSENEKA